jgi:hydrogenase maturation protease
MQIVIIGIGQSLRGDDAAGLEAVKLWEGHFQSAASQPDIRLEHAETPGLTLLSLLEGAEAAILVDAVQSGAAPGTIHTLEESKLPAFLDGSSSAHGWGVAETLAIGRKTGMLDLPDKIMLVGIEIRQVEMGAGLSPEVQAVLPQAAQQVESTVQNWLSQGARE